MNEGTMVRRTT